MIKFSLYISFVLFCCSLAINDLKAQSVEQQLDRILTTRFSSSEPGVTALIAKNGEIIYQKSVGMAHLELEIPIQEDHVFRIASITKQFTAVAILQLAEKGLLSLQDDIRKYISDFLPTQSTPITIEHLLSHTSGIEDYNRTKDWEKAALTSDLSSKALIDIFKKKPLAFNPGEQFQYSNLGYLTLGYIVEIVAGIPFSEYLEKNIFQPLKMTQTSYDQTSLILPRRIPGYTKSNSIYFNADYLDMRIPKAAGGLHSSLGDLLIWYNSLFKNQLISPEYLKIAHTPFKLSNERLAPYGFGWRVGNIVGIPSIKHDGIINGFTSIVIYLPEQEVFVALLSNCDCNRDIEIPASKMAAITLGKPFKETPVKVSNEALINYQGTYRTADGKKKRISYQDGTLVYYDKGGTKTKMIPIDKNQFKLSNELSFLEFSENYYSFRLNATGLPSRWERTSEEAMTFKSIELDSITLEKFIGKYQFPKAFTFEVVKVSDKMYGQVGSDRHEILAYDKNKFFARTIDARLIFNLNENGEVTSLTLIQNQEMNAKKLSPLD